MKIYMLSISIVGILFALCGYAAWQYYLVPELGKTQKPDKNKLLLTLVLAFAFIVRVICAVIYRGHTYDMNCFTSWANTVFENGVGQFYQSAGFTDYPPGYMYILYVVGALKHLFNADGTALNLLVKLPAIIADIISGCIVYIIASKKFSNGLSAMLAAIYVFNPAVILDSSLWGQVDSVYTLSLMVMIWLLTEKKTEIAYFVFAVCILIKPQSFIYTPIILFAIIERYIYPEFNPNKLLKSLTIGVGAIIFMILLAVPFGLNNVIEQYVRSIGEEYPYFTINAFNIWGLFGLNWSPLTVFGSIAVYFILAAIVIYTAYIFFKSKSETKYYYAAAMLAFFTYILSTKMHERYSFPAMAFMLLAIIGTKHIHSFALYLLTSITQFLGYAWVLFIYGTDINKYAFCPTVRVLSAINIAVFIYMIFVTQKYYVSNRISTDNTISVKSPAPPKKIASAKSNSVQTKKGFKFQTTKTLAKLTRVDFIAIAAIMLVYGSVALYNLGDTAAPESEIRLAQGSSRIELSEAQQISAVKVFLDTTPLSSSAPLIVTWGSDETAIGGSHIVESGAARSWVSIPINANAKYITLSTGGEDLYICEAQVTDTQNNLISVQPSDTNNTTALFDEPDATEPFLGVNLSSSVAELASDPLVSELKFYLGARELNSTDRPLSVTAIDKNNKIVYSKNLTSGAVFYWSTENIDQNVSKLILSTISPELYIEEMALTDSSNNPIEPTGYVHSDDSALFDEQSLVPDRSSYRNSTYFDEIYHARTAYEFLHHLSVYEWTHPPLGKVFISIGIAISGMCPFGWRIAGTIFGILMIPLIYVFAKRLLGKSFLAVITCLLFTFDFMHFAQTRIATIDVYVTFFIIMMYFFMYKYATMSFFDTPLRKTFVPLAFCGISMGLGIASKWTGIYAGAGLAVIFFLIMAMRYREYSYAKREPKGETNGIKHSYVIENYASHTAKTIGWCLIFFVLVPALIYGLSYIPYLMTDGAQGIKTIFDNQESMLTYHGSTVLGSTHPFSSRWYEWIIMKRPIWYYSGSLDNGLKEGISSFGNPLVWWIGIPAFCWMVVTAVTNKDKTAIFLCIAYIAELLPWVGVERLTFIYHYFPCVPFITLMIGYSIKTIYDEARIKHRKAITIGVCVYAAAVIGMFILFYPVLSGKPCSYEFAEHFLKWFDTWVLL